MGVSRAEAIKVLRSRVLAPLQQHGFSLLSRRPAAHRLRDGIIDVVGVQIGQGLSGYYIHTFMNLASNPIANHLASYRVGYRVHRHPDTDVIWSPENESELSQVFESMADYVERHSLAYFGSVQTMKDYVIEIISDVNDRVYDFDLAVALGWLGKSNKVYWLCEEVMKTARTVVESGDEDERRRIYELARTLRGVANDSGRMHALLTDWQEATAEAIDAA